MSVSAIVMSGEALMSVQVKASEVGRRGAVPSSSRWEQMMGKGRGKGKGEGERVG